MVFKSPRMEKLRERFRNTDDFHVPFPVSLDRVDTLTGEQAHLAEIISSPSISDEVRKDWTGRLLNDDPGQHFGAWFEIKLSDWLRSLGDLTVGPSINELTPDFLLTTPTDKVLIEACTYQKRELERHHESISNSLFVVLNNISQSYLLSIHVVRIGSDLDVKYLRKEVDEWLCGEASQSMLYSDKYGTELEVGARFDPDRGTCHVGSVGGPTTQENHYRSLSSTLSKKATKYKSILDSTYAYVVAVLLLPHSIDQINVHEILFGQSTYYPELDKVRFQGNGILLRNGRPLNRSVSGILSCTPTWNKDLNRNEFHATYFPNPHARVPITENLFPASPPPIELPSAT